MKYSIKDFAEGKIIVRSTEAEWPEFVKAYRAAGCKDYDRGYRGDVGAYISPNTGYVTGNYTRGTRLPEVNFSDLAPINPTPADFYAGRVGVRCDTREEYDALMRECEGKGVKWNCGVLPTKWHPFVFGEKPPMKFFTRNGTLCWRSMEQDCFGAPHVPFRAIFPDPWDEFAAGKAYLRVKKAEWVEFAKRCEAAGMEWRSGGKPSDRKPGALVKQDYALVFYWPDDLRGLDAKFAGATPTDKPVIDFSTLLPAPAKAPEPPAPYDGRGKHKVGDRFEVITGGDNFNVGDIIRLCDDDGSICPKFERLSDGEQHYKIWRNLKPYIPTPSLKIVITTDRRVTTATLYEDGKAVLTGTATCSPEDEFEFFTGATIAYNRVRFGQQFQPTKFAEFMALSKKIKALGAEIEKQVGKL